MSQRQFIFQNALNFLANCPYWSRTFISEGQNLPKAAVLHIKMEIIIILPEVLLLPSPTMYKDYFLHVLLINGVLKIALSGPISSVVTRQMQRLFYTTSTTSIHMELWLFVSNGSQLAKMKKYTALHVTTIKFIG